MTLAIKNIAARIALFSECLQPFDDAAIRYDVLFDVVCFNCGEICKKNSFAGKTSDRGYAHLCFGCARAFQHCSRRKNVVDFLQSFRDCFQSGYVSKATTGVHAHYKNISPQPKIRCFNCGCNCKDEYFHGIKDDPSLRLYQISSIGQVLTMPHPYSGYADICFNCCRAFFVGQAFPFSSESFAFEFHQLGMKPHLCLTRETAKQHFIEKHWLMMQIQEWHVPSTISKPVEKPDTQKRCLKTTSY